MISSYPKIKTNLFFINLAFGVFFLIAFLITGASLRLESWVTEFLKNKWLIILVYFAGFSIIYFVVSFPFRFYEGYKLEHRFDLSNQSLVQWLKDDLKSAILNFILFSVFILLLFLLIDRLPSIWWLVMGIVWFMITVVLSRVAARIILPLFFKYYPLEEGELRDKLIALGGKAGLDIPDIYKIELSSKTKKPNALVIGWGKARKLMLSDTLLEEFSIPEVMSVTAHEMGHYKHRDFWKLLVVGSVLSLGGFYWLYVFLKFLDRLILPSWDIVYTAGIIPLFLLLLGIFFIIVLPIQNFFSRAIESQADRFSLDVTKDPDSFIQTMEKLARMNLSETDPARWKKVLLFDHPSIVERVRMAEEFK